MKIEYEATFINIEKEEARKRLKDAKANLVRPEFLQKRFTFNLPEGKEIKGGFVRLRDEGDKITLTLKVVDGNKISDQKETMTIVDNFDATAELLAGIGCKAMSYEETRRELWKINDVEVTVDTWPFIGSIVEVEGKSEDEVKAVSAKLGFDWKDAKFCSIGALYIEKYGLGPMDLAKKTGKQTRLVFEEKNPFV